MYLSPLFKGLQKEIVLIIAITLSFVAGYFIEKLVTVFIKNIQRYKDRISSLLSGKLNRLLIFATMLLAMAMVLS